MGRTVAPGQPGGRETPGGDVNYAYLALLIPGFLLSVAGFVFLGKKLHPVLTGLMFLSGIVAMVLGILLTCVPDFFAG